MLALLIGLAVQVTSSDNPVTLQDVWKWSKFEAADRLLARDAAERVIDGTFNPGLHGGLFHGYWWTVATPHNPGTCERSTYRTIVDFSDPASVPREPNESLQAAMQWSGSGSTEYALSYPDIATRETCARLTGWVYARQEDQQQTVESMHRLADAISAAASDQILPFNVSIICDQITEVSCPQPREALRDLPLGELHGIIFATNGVEQAHGKTSGDAAQLTADELPLVKALFRPIDDQFTWSVSLNTEDGHQTVTLHRGGVILP